MAYRIGIDEEEEKRRAQSANQKRLGENTQYRNQYVGGANVSGNREKVSIDLSQYQPSDIADLGFRMPKEQRTQFLDFAQQYYKNSGAKNIPKADDISAQWDAWDAERDNTLRQNTIREKEGMLNPTGSLNKIGTLSAIAGMADGGEKDAAKSAYAQLMGTVGSKYYSPYIAATSEPLKTLGVDAVDDAWFARNADYTLDLLKDPATGKPTKPGNSATDAQKRAYSIYILKGNEDQTKQAETELETLYGQIAEAAQGSGFDAAEYVAGINWKDYPMLSKMLEGEKTGAYPQLNRAVPLSIEGLYGAAYCAQKGIDVTDTREYELYAGAWVNDLQREAKIGTNEEEPEGFLEGIWDTVSGEKKDREARIAQGEAARATLEALGVALKEEKPQVQETEKESYERAQRETALPEWVKEPTTEARIKMFQQGTYGFIDNAQDRSALKAIDAQIKTLQEQKEEAKKEKNGMLFGSQMAMAYRGNTSEQLNEQLNGIDEEISRLNAKKLRIAFSGSGETADTTRVTQMRKAAPGKTAGLEITPESAIGVLENYAQLDEDARKRAQENDQNLKPPIGWGSTEYNLWLSASTDEMDAVYKEYDAAMARAKEMDDSDAKVRAMMAADYELTEGVKRAQLREETLRGLIPEDEETAAARAGVDAQRISLLCEREVASTMGDEETVKAINDRLIQAGYKTCWPEEDAIAEKERADAIAYAKGWGDEEVRKRLDIKDGRELTDEDYYKAAHTDKGFWDWDMWRWNQGKTTDKQTREEQREELEKYAQIAKENGPWETMYGAFAQGTVGKDASIEQRETAKDVYGAIAAIEGGAIRGITAPIQGAIDMTEAFCYEAAKAQYGSKLTREQMEMLSPGYKMVSDAKKTTDTMANVVTADTSQRSGWVNTLGGLTESVIQNMTLAKAGSAVGKVATNFARMIGIKDVTALANVYRKTSDVVRSTGFALSGVKSGLAEAKTLGLEGEDALTYAFISAGISATVENMNIDPFTQTSRTMNAIPNGAQAAAKGWREWFDKAGQNAAKWAISGAGEGLEEVVESPLQNIKKKIMADPDMKWFGEGGVIDPKEMAQSGAMGFASGFILAGAADVGTRPRTEKLPSTRANTRRTPEVAVQAQTDAKTQQETEVAAQTQQTEADVQESTNNAQAAENSVQETQQERTPEQIAQKAQDYAEVMEIISDDHANDDVIAIAEIAVEEIEQNGAMSDETRATLRGLIGLKRIKLKMIMEDVVNMAKIIGSEMTSPQTKQMAQEAWDAVQGTEPMDPAVRRAVTEAAARDIARATAQAGAQEARKELEKATLDEKDIRKEYGQMNGRMNALTDNMSRLIQQGLSSGMTSEIQGMYQTLLNKVNSLKKRIENQKARLREAQERKKAAQTEYDQAAEQAKNDEETIYQQMVNEGAKPQEATVDAQTDANAQTQQNPEAELDKATAQALEAGDEQAALNIQKAKEGVKDAAGKVSQESETGTQSEAREEVQEEVPPMTQAEIEALEGKWDRFEDYDVKGFKRHMKETPIYLDDQQRAELKYITGMNHSRFAFRHGIRFTSDRTKGRPLDGGTWSDISGYFPGILDEGSYHPLEDLVKLLEDIKENEKDLKGGRLYSLRKRTHTEGAGVSEAPTKSGQQIIEGLKVAFPGVTVRARSPVGAINDEGGYADLRTSGARVVGLRNVEDVVHEIGHLLSVKNGGVNEVQRSEKGRIEEGSVRVKPEHIAGVDAMVEKLRQENPETLAGYQTVEQRRQEAIAEFWTRWMQGEEAARAFAGDALFDVLTGTADRNQMKALEEARREYIILQGATQAQRDEAQIVSERAAREREAEAAIEHGIYAGAMEAVFDENYAAMMIDAVSLESTQAGMSKKEIKAKRKKAKKTGALMMEETDRVYYKQANLSKAAGVVRHWVNDLIIGRNGVLMDTSIMKAVEPIGAQERKAFGRYVMLLNELDARNLQEKHRAEAEKNEMSYVPRANDYYNLAWADRDINWVRNQIAQMEAEHTQFKSVHEGLRKIWNVLMEEYQIKPGFVENAQEAWEKVNADRPHFLPTRAIQNNAVKEETHTTSIAKEQREIKGAKAGERDIVDPIMTMISELARMAHQSAAMEVKNTIARVYDEYEGQGRFFREIPAEQVNAQQEMFKTIADKGSFNLMDVDTKTAEGIIDSGTNTEERRVIVAIENGKARYFEVLDQMVYDMLARTETPERAGQVLRAAKQAARMVNNLFRGTTTILNPFFGPKNAPRDFSTGLVTGTQKNPIEFAKTYLDSIWQAARYYHKGKLDGDNLIQFAAMGGLEGDAYSHDVEGERAKLKDVYKEEGKRLRRMMDNVIECMADFNDTIEAGMRFAQFQEGLKAGQSIDRAFRISQEATSDFLRTGRMSKKMSRYFYFFNATLQGTYDAIHTMEEGKFDPQRSARFIQRSIIYAAAAPLLQALMRMLWDDDDWEKYNNLAENVKRENNVFFFVGSKAIYLPKGQSFIFTLGDAIGRTWVEGMMREVRNGNPAGDYFRHEGIEDVWELTKDLWEDVNPMQSSIFQTISDIANNRNHWGDPITPDYMQGWDARNQYDSYTSSVAVMLGQFTGAFGISPKMIHYAIDQQTGFVGDLILKLTTPSSGYGKTWEEREDIGDFLLDNLLAIPSLLSDMATKGFTSDIRLVSSVREDFEQYKDFFGAVISEYDQYDGDRNKMRGKISRGLSDKEYAKAYSDAVAINKYLSKARTAINKLYKEMKENPEATIECQDAIMQIQMVSNQVAESWQRRYMDANLNVQVKIPKGDF